MSRRRAFTLIEIMVTMAVVATSLALLLPALLQGREAARRVQCKNQLKQFGFALHNYVDAFTLFPPSLCLPLDDLPTQKSGWSAHGRLLPFLDLAVAFQQIHLEYSWDDPINQATGVPQLPVPIFACPSDPMSSTVRYAGPSQGYVFPISYALNFGSWLVFDPLTKNGGDGCFFPNSQLGATNIYDGMSNTICAAEVKTFQPYFRNTGNPGPIPVSGEQGITGLASRATLRLGPVSDQNGGHTRWCDGFVTESGFTTVFTPNSFVELLVDGYKYSVDFTSRLEGSSASIPTYSANTSRSHHGGIVNVLFMDGSVHTVADAVSLSVWRALGTRAGSETVIDF